MKEPLSRRTLNPADLTLLRRIPLFSVLTADELEKLSERLDHRHFAKGAIVYHQDDEPGDLFVVQRGLIKSQLIGPNGRRLTLSFHRPGHYFGPLSLMDEKRRAVDSVAVEPSELLVLSSPDFRSFLLQHPSAAPILLDRYVSLTRIHLQSLHDHVFLDGRSRLAKALLAQSRSTYDDHLVHLTQAELAAVTATTPESVSRWLKDFTREGLISVSRGRVRILDVDKLEMEAE